MTYPDAASGWTKHEPKKDSRYPSYSRSDGWRVALRHLNDIQIMATYTADLYYHDSRISPRGIGWGSSAVTGLMGWVNKKVGLAKSETSTTDSWPGQVCDLLRTISNNRELPENLRREAQWLEVVGASQ